MAANAGAVPPAGSPADSSAGEDARQRAAGRRSVAPPATPRAELRRPGPQDLDQEIEAATSSNDAAESRFTARDSTR